MKYYLIFSILSATFISATLEAAIKPKVSTPEEKAARAQRRLKALNETGGFIADPRNAYGTYSFINCVNNLSNEIFKSGAIKCQNSCLILTEVRNANIEKFSFDKAEIEFRKSGCIMATFFIDEESWPLLIICPEKRFAVVNINKLKSDNPTKENFKSRIRKMMSRSVGQVFQAGYAFSSVSTMNLISGAKELDRIATEGLATECTTVIHATAAKFGFCPMTRVLYRKAVEEGWAPPPINSFQKSAWDKVRSEKERGPTNPIEIPMPKK